jgi:hypothetical protein
MKNHKQKNKVEVAKLITEVRKELKAKALKEAKGDKKLAEKIYQRYLKFEELQ